MWRINKVKCKNFISFKEMEVEIPQHQCTLIYGINLDNDKQKNNGTGKSSLIEAIAFGLTGEPLRGVDKTEEIINDHADTAEVTVELINDYEHVKFVVSRTIARKTPQQITCSKFDADGNEIDTDKTTQPTVNDYNRYVLEEVGLTKDDIYSNYILSNARYKSFFEASDKQKKAMINRFSGADAVDKAIEALQEDKRPVQEAYDKAKENQIAADAKVEAIEQQIKELEDTKEDFERSKAERIKALEDKIAVKRSEIRERKETIKSQNDKLDEIDEAGAQIEDMQKDKKSLSEMYKEVNDLLGKYDLRKTADYPSLSKKYEDQIGSKQEEKEDLENRLTELNQRLSKANKNLDKAKETCEKMQKQNAEDNEQSKKNLAAIAQKIDDMKFKVGEQHAKIEMLKETSDNLDGLIREANNMLHGMIVCPKCKHEFFLNEKKDVEEVKNDLKDYQKKFDKNEKTLSDAKNEESKMKDQQLSLNDEKDKEDGAITARMDKMRELKSDINNATIAVTYVNSEITEVKSSIRSIEVEIQDQKERIHGLVKKMLQEALDIVDDVIDSGERYVKGLKEDNIASQSTIEAYERSIEDIKNSSQNALKTKMEQSLAELKKSRQDANSKLAAAQKELDKYTIQENHFVEFRSYLANKKVEAIAGVTNYFLELIGSDLRVEMLGYKKLKNGNIRDKITVNLLRNGVPCGSFCKFSGGERARVNLASILGLQKLTNNSADNGKGLDIVVLDEILEASDTTGIESSCEALNRLKVTSLMVTQNPIIGAEVNTMIVKKENGYSEIEQG